MAISITLVPNPFSRFAISALPPSAAIVSAVLARFRTVAGNDSNTLRAALIQPIGLVSWFMAYVVNIDYTSQQISTDQMWSSGICCVAQLRTDASPSRCLGGDQFTFPPASAFTVKADGVEVTVQSVARTLPDTLALRLSATIKQGQTVTVSYTVPESGTVIEDTVGNDALAFTDFEVTNNSTVDETPPIPASAAVGASGASLNLTFNEDLDIGPSKLPPADAFTVKADGVEVAVQAVVIGSDKGNFVLRLPPAAIGERQIVTVSYAVPTTGTVIEDTAGNDAVGFEDFPVTNNSTVANTTPPVPASAEVASTGASLTLTFNEDLDIAADKLPPASAFTVKADGDEVTVESVALGTDPDHFVLNLPDEAIKQCHTVTVDYAVPTTNPIQDADGREAVAFTGFEVVNNSTVECPNDNSPVFPAPDPRMLTVEENVPLGTAIGVPVTATDADGDTLTYSLDDSASTYSRYFQINSETGQLQTNDDLAACAVEVLMLGDWRAAAGEMGFWPECGHLARPTLGWKSQTGRPERKRFAFHTRSMGTARPGASALAGQHLPQHVATVPIRLMFNAKHTRSHSPRTFAKPRRLNRRNPSTSLIHPFGASESHLRCAYRALPAGLASFSPMRCVAGSRAGSTATWDLPSRPSATCASMPRSSSSNRSGSLQ